jgi:hypothetical protein|tara:strand:+ start:6149 stop:6388 length:240 start_codon:yes stop_codon:yes gene_type:complete
MAKGKRKYTTTRSDLDRKQSTINFSNESINSDSMGMGDFKFTSLTAHQIAPSDPAQDEGRLYVRDKDGILYYITATKVG